LRPCPAGCPVLQGPGDRNAPRDDRLAGYKRPKRIEIAAALPKNASGKVLERELRETFLAQS